MVAIWLAHPPSMPWQAGLRSPLMSRPTACPHVGRAPAGQKHWLICPPNASTLRLQICRQARNRGPGLGISFKVLVCRGIVIHFVLRSDNPFLLPLNTPCQQGIGRGSYYFQGKLQRGKRCNLRKNCRSYIWDYINHKLQLRS